MVVFESSTIFTGLTKDFYYAFGLTSCYPISDFEFLELPQAMLCLSCLAFGVYKN
jgi:hypothetical protein